MVTTAEAYKCTHCNKIIIDKIKAENHEERCLKTISSKNSKALKEATIKEYSLKMRTTARNFNEIEQILNECGRQIYNTFKLKIEGVGFSTSSYSSASYFDPKLVSDNQKCAGHFVAKISWDKNSYDLDAFLKPFGFYYNSYNSFRIHLGDLAGMCDETRTFRDAVLKFNADLDNRKKLTAISFRADPKVLEIYHRKMKNEAAVNKIQKELEEAAVKFNEAELEDYKSLRILQPILPVFLKGSNYIDYDKFEQISL